MLDVSSYLLVQPLLAPRCGDDIADDLGDGCATGLEAGEDKLELDLASVFTSIDLFSRLWGESGTGTHHVITDC